jgi:transposase
MTEQAGVKKPMKTYSEDLRQRIILAKYETNVSDQEIANRFQVSRSFVNKLVRQYKKTRSYKSLPHGGGKTPLLQEKEIIILLELVEEDNDATLKELRERLEKKTGITVSIATICRALKKQGVTRKKKTIHASEAATERVQKLRQEYWESIRDINLDDLVFLDETGVNLAMTRHYGRATKGKRAYGKCPYNRGSNYTLIGAITKKGMLASLTFEGWTNTDTFLVYIEEVLAPKLWPGAVVVMDNLKAHQATKVKKALAESGAKIIFLSPYSPEFNPIENCWSKIKEYLRSQEARNPEKLYQAINEAINSVTDNDIIGWLTHCCYYAPSD